MILVAQKRLSVFLSHLFLQPVLAKAKKDQYTNVYWSFGRSSGI